MGGTWSPTSPPSDPGFYVNFEAMATATVSGGQTGVVLIPLHDAVWGPAGSNEFYSLAEYDRVYSNADVGARKAVAGAFTGTGYRPGAERVIVFRINTDNTLAKAAEVTEDGLTFTGRYPGEYINGWTISVMSDPINTTEHVVTLTDTDGRVRWSMEYTCLAGDLADAIGPEPNNWFTVTGTYNGGDITAAAFVDGADLKLASDLESVIETEILNNDFNVVTTYDDDTSGVVLAITENAKKLNLEGKRFMAVVGGEEDESIDDAVAAAVALGNENIVRVGYTDLETVDGVVVSTAKFAPQLAGIIAANGPFRSITANHISGMRVFQKATKSDLRKARNAGVVMLVEDQIGARLYQDMTTYTAETIYKPRKEFGVIKAVMVHHQVETDLTRAAESGWIGGSNVNTENYRRAVLDGITGYLMRIEGAAMIQPGWYVGLDDEYDNTGDSIHIKYGIKTTRVVERILNTIVLH